MKPSILLFALFSLAATTVHAQQERVIVFPVEAIADGAKLDKEDFFERYPGIDATQFGLTDEGWYVRYQHELLTYLYGPVEDLDYARRQKKLLEEIRLSLVLKSPSLSSSKVDIIRFDFNATPDNLGVEQVEDNPYIRDDE
ncbi:hypothetical protein [Pelagicoccus sp. SDUM812003]|uniref:hypothetical protein n=1 Tax=Pelagicoccus sp. SDUM812003 TaxID=3041267 RepID=UPI00280CC47B|nr:hypothetical protein [Pelagicoccus sp. SDUM812003]MDQ8205155.1 hypothetical protein [Pelagicoccus sp. SDUM812003]